MWKRLDTKTLERCITLHKHDPTNILVVPFFDKPMLVNRFRLDVPFGDSSLQKRVSVGVRTNNMKSYMRKDMFVGYVSV